LHIGAPFRPGIEADIGKDRRAQISAPEVRPSQVGGRQINVAHPGTPELRMPQVSMVETRPPQICLAEVSTREERLVRLYITEHGVTEVSPRKSGLDECCADQ
jgi:hypothetical protein